MRTRIATLMMVAAALSAVAPAAAFGDQTSDFAVVPGAQPQPWTQTIPTWRDTYTDGASGSSYSETIVGSADPRSPGAGTTTIPADVIPIDLSFDANGGQAFNGSDTVPAVLNSPIFKGADYSAFSNNNGVQYLDAVMRSQFNQVGSSGYHLKLSPSVMPTLTLNVPRNRGQIERYPSGAQYGCVESHWLFDRMWEYMNTQSVRPTTLPIFLVEYTRGGAMVNGTCVPVFSGVHGAGNPAAGWGSFNSQTLGQTWILATYEPSPIRPVTPDHPYTYTNVDVLSHEVSEWANDPFAENAVRPYTMPTPGYGSCDDIFETGDPVAKYTYNLPGNKYFQNLPGNDGTWQVQDEVFLPWFARESPNVTSEPDASSGHGRYTFFGDLNPDPLFHAVATDC